MKLPWKQGDEKEGNEQEGVEQEFERSVAADPKPPGDRNQLDRERHFGGEPLLDQPAEVDAEAEAAEWEKRYGSEASRDKLGFDGN